MHPELFGAVLFDDDGVPAIVDLVPCWRPKEWAAAVVVVDALAWGGADVGLLHRWAHLDEWPQMLLRAVLHRLALHAQHPEASARTLAGLERAAGLVSAPALTAPRDRLTDGEHALARASHRGDSRVTVRSYASCGRGKVPRRRR